MALRITLLGRTRNVPTTAAALQVELERLCAENERECRARPYPPLRRTRVRYRRELPGREEWLTAREILARGFADCEDLACYEVGRLRAMGLRANPALERQKTLGLWHVVVVLPDGRTFDPSAQQGME